MRAAGKQLVVDELRQELGQVGHRLAAVVVVNADGDEHAVTEVEGGTEAIRLVIDATYDVGGALLEFVEGLVDGSIKATKARAAATALLAQLGLAGAA